MIDNRDPLTDPALRRVLRSYERRLKSDIETLTRMVDEYPDHDWWDERLAEAKAERRALAVILRASDPLRRPARPDPLRRPGRPRGRDDDRSARRRDIRDMQRTDMRGMQRADRRRTQGTEGRRRAAQDGGRGPEGDRELSDPPEIPDVLSVDRSGVPAPLAGWLTRLSFAQLSVVMVAVAEELWHRDPPDGFDARSLIKGTGRLMTTVRAVIERGGH